MDSATIFDRYYNLSLRYLSYRPRSEKEIKDYLENKVKSQKSSIRQAQDKQVKNEIQNEKLTSEIVDSIIVKLKDYKFLDDREFSKFWVEQRTKFKRKPIRVIEYELSQKGISKSLIEEIFAELDIKDLDLENAKKLAEKKLEFYRSLDPDKRREKVMGFLLRRGFNYDIVRKILG